MVADQRGTSFVIIDFDSCAINGHPLPEKRGPMPEGVCTARIENDDLGIERVQAELYRSTWQ